MLDIVIKLPVQLIRNFVTHQDKSPFAQHATLFQDLVIRCVRYAFAHIPASVGRVFLSKQVALPFLYFRMLRHRALHPQMSWREINPPGFRGIWLTCDDSQKPSIVIYYCHGGGFSMGSSYFYLEFLIAWLSLLKDSGYKNPALLALEYTLVPEAKYPQQIHETLAGYEFLLDKVEDSSRICLSGDSAGATLQLSLLLYMSKESDHNYPLPGYAVMISPWSVIISPNNKDTPSDYLNAESLRLYGSQYIGTKAWADDPMVSPGMCKDAQWWRRASPSKGWFFVYGAEEVFTPETRKLVSFLSKNAGTKVTAHEEEGWIHAWPVVKLFLCQSQEARQSGLKSMVKAIRENID